MSKPLKRDLFPHYHKKSGFEYVDVYRVLELFGVTSATLQHAIKKLLVAGGRGAKDITRDVREAIETLERWEEMRAEEAPAPHPPTAVQPDPEEST